jgi:hypothetical protein
MADAAFMAELKHWIRFNPRSAMRSGDGLFSAASGNPGLPTVLGERAFSAFVTAKGRATNMRGRSRLLLRWRSLSGMKRTRRIG